MTIYKNDSWYYQVQGQLHITKRKLCLFAVWSGENQMMTVEKILRDDDFWNKNMVAKLTEFYMEHILAELIDPRHTRNMLLRQPIIPIQVASRKNSASTLDEASQGHGVNLTPGFSSFLCRNSTHC